MTVPILSALNSFICDVLVPSIIFIMYNYSHWHSGKLTNLYYSKSETGSSKYWPDMECKSNS